MGSLAKIPTGTLRSCTIYSRRALRFASGAEPTRNPCFVRRPQASAQVESSAAGIGLFWFMHKILVRSQGKEEVSAACCLQADSASAASRVHDLTNCSLASGTVRDNQYTMGISRVPAWFVTLHEIWLQLRSRYLRYFQWGNRSVWPQVVRGGWSWQLRMGRLVVATGVQVVSEL